MQQNNQVVVKPNFGWHIVYFFCFLAVGLLLAWGSQYFIAGEAAKRLSSQLASSTLGHWFYPAADASNGKPKITVFALDDNDLDFFKNTYPLPYGFHARMLDAIGILSPKAVFLDIWFHDQRDDPSVGKLVEAICRLHKDGTRVYLASMAHQDEGGPGLRPELRAITTPATGPLSLEKKPGACAVEVAVSKDVDVLDRQTWRYDLATGAPNQRIFSAAAQIYNDLPGYAPLTLAADPLALIWGVKGAELNRQPPGFGLNEDTGCRNAWFAMDAVPIPMALKQIFKPDVAKPFCTYHATLPLSALRKMPGEALQPLVEDRLIVYGGNLQSLNDVLYSPVHGRLAGMHMHAMALDNLLNFGNAYPKAEGFDIKKLFSAGTLFTFLMLCIFSAIATLLQWRRNTNAHQPACTRLWLLTVINCCEDFKNLFRPILSAKLLRPVLVAFVCVNRISTYLGLPAFLVFIKKWVVRAVLAIGLLYVVAWIGLRMFHLGPLSWIEYAIFAMLMELFATAEKVHTYVYPKLRDVKGWSKKGNGCKKF